MTDPTVNHRISEVFYRLNVGAPLDEGLLEEAFGLILINPHVQARDTQLGAFLTGLMVRTPTVREILVLIRTALNIDGIKRFRPTLPQGELLVGVAGSGKKGLKTFNISTAACFVASAEGVYIAKPGSSATSSVSGSKDLIYALGAVLLDTPEMIEVMHQTKLGIFPIESQIPRFDAVYGGKIFGPTPLSFGLPAIVNPLACDAVYYGLAHPNVELAQATLLGLGFEDAMVVTSSHDSVHFVDELSSLSQNKAGLIKDGVMQSADATLVSDLKFDHCDATALQAKDSLFENVQYVLQVLKGKSPESAKRTVALNAAGILLLAKKSETFADAYVRSVQAIESGAAYEKLCQFVEATGGSIRTITNLMGE